MKQVQRASLLWAVQKVSLPVQPWHQLLMEMTALQGYTLHVPRIAAIGPHILLANMQGFPLSLIEVARAPTTLQDAKGWVKLRQK